MDNVLCDELLLFYRCISYSEEHYPRKTVAYRKDFVNSIVCLFQSFSSGVLAFIHGALGSVCGVYGFIDVLRGFCLFVVVCWLNRIYF